MPLSSSWWQRYVYCIDVFEVTWSHLSLHTHTQHGNFVMHKETAVTAYFSRKQLPLFAFALRELLLILAPFGSVMTHLRISFEVSLSGSGSFITFSGRAIDTRDYALQFVKLYIDRCPYNTKSSALAQLWFNVCWWCTSTNPSFSQRSIIWPSVLRWLMIFAGEHAGQREIPDCCRQMPRGTRANPEDTRPWTIVGLVLGHRLRRWPDTRPALVQAIMHFGKPSRYTTLLAQKSAWETDNQVMFSIMFDPSPDVFF